MHVFILTLGTRGDFEQFLALGRELRGRGHRVVIGTSGFFAGRVRESGIDFVQAGDGTYDDLLAVLRSLGPVRDRAERTRRYYRGWLKPQVDQATRQITSIGAETDYFVSNLKIALQRPGGVVPGASVTYDPPWSVDDLARYGGGHGGRTLELVALNRRLIDPEGVWGDRYHFTGFWHGSEAGREPTPELAAFADAAEPPVVVTLGSMATGDTGRLAAVVADALRLTGRRGVFVGGWSELPRPGDDRMLAVREAPYDWLFPRAACVVHHGGCGTVAAALRAGKPSVLLPQVTCQELFGRALLRERLAAAVLDSETLTPAELARAIESTADERALLSTAEWQRAVTEEGGVRAAVDLIEAHHQGVAS